MINVNDKGLVYFGTSIENLNILINGLNKPLFRNEQYISVSISGYSGQLPVAIHNEIEFLANVYCNKYGTTINNNGCLEWKSGYRNSLTFIDGFGPNDNKTYNCFGEEKENNIVGEKIALVLSSEEDNLVIPKKAINDIPFEYFSTALHAFIREIKTNKILGIIADRQNKNTVFSFLKKNNINIEIWSVENI